MLFHDCVQWLRRNDPGEADREPVGQSRGFPGLTCRTSTAEQQKAHHFQDTRQAFGTEYEFWVITNLVERTHSLRGAMAVTTSTSPE